MKWAERNLNGNERVAGKGVLASGAHLFSEGEGAGEDERTGAYRRYGCEKMRRSRRFCL